MYTHDCCINCGPDVMFEWLLVPYGVVRRCINCGHENFDSNSRDEREKIAETVYTENIENAIRFLKSNSRTHNVYFNLISGKIMKPTEISDDNTKRIKAIAEYAGSTVRRMGLLKKPKYYSNENFRLLSLTYVENKLIYHLLEGTYKRMSNGELIPEDVIKYVSAIREALIAYEDGQYVMACSSETNDTALPNTVEEWFDEISRTFSLEVMRNSEQRLIEQFSLHCMIPTIIRTIKICGKMFFIVSSPENRDFVTENCANCTWMKKIHSEFIVQKNKVVKKRWKNNEGKKAIQNPYCSQSFSYLPCLPKLMMKFRHEISPLRRKLRKLEKSHSSRELFMNYPDYTKNLVLYTILGLFLEISGLFSLKVKYNENYDKFISKKLEEYGSALTQLQAFFITNGVSCESLLFGETLKITEILQNIIQYLKEKNFGVAVNCVQKLATEFRPSFSKFFSEFAKIITYILTNLKEDLSSRNGGAYHFLGKENIGLNDNKAERLLSFFYMNKKKRKYNMSIRVDFLQAMLESRKVKPYFNRRDLPGYPDSTTTNILNEFKKRKIIERVRNRYRLKAKIIELAIIIRGLDMR